MVKLTAAILVLVPLVLAVLMPWMIRRAQRQGQAAAERWLQDGRDSG
jgi:uncharacterized membrane protein YjgN (DUF898 family)